MPISIQKSLRLYETSVLFFKEGFSGSIENAFRVESGSRLIFTLQIISIEPGAKAKITVKNGFSIDSPLSQVLEIQLDQVGQATRILTDFHNIFDVELSVEDGSADVAVGVSVADNANSTRIENAVIETDVSAYLGVDGKYDSIRLGDGVNEAKVNPNGSINVNVVDGEGEDSETKEVPGEALSVATGIETIVAAYTVPTDTKALLQRIDFGGSNIAEFRYYKNSAKVGVKRTFWSGGLSGSFEFFTGSEEGIPLEEGDKVEVKVVHLQQSSGDFEGRIQVREIAV